MTKNIIYKKLNPEPLPFKFRNNVDPNKILGGYGEQAFFNNKLIAVIFAPTIDKKYYYTLRFLNDDYTLEQDILSRDKNILKKIIEKII